MSARGATAPRQEDREEVSFRRAELVDVPALARLARDAWPARPGKVSRESEAAGMEGYVEHSMNASNWREVALSSEGILGFLFGRIDGYRNVPAPKRSMLGELPQAIRSFFRKGRTTPWHFAMVWGIVLTELKLMVKMPRSDASIEMFIVNSKQRGRGIGTELIDRFLWAAEEAGSTLVTVYSDDRMSDWQFYERYGFEKIGTFHDNITSFYSGGDARGIILALGLRDEG